MDLLSAPGPGAGTDGYCPGPPGPTSAKTAAGECERERLSEQGSAAGTGDAASCEKNDDEPPEDDDEARGNDEAD